MAFYVEVCHARDLVPFPVTVESMRLFAALLKTTGYRAGNCYLSAVLKCNDLSGFRPSEELLHERSVLGRGMTRGLGEDHHMLPIGPGILIRMRDLLRKGFSNYQLLVFRLGVIACFWMLRSDEVLHVRRKHVRGKDGIAVSLMIAKEKNNISEKNVIRRVKCICGEDEKRKERVRVCPVCAIFGLIRMSERDGKGEEWMLSRGAKNESLGYDGFLKGIRGLVCAIGFQEKNEEKRHNYGTHSFRRGGAQSLARNGWTLEAIMRWGRWESAAVKRYVKDIIFEQCEDDLAHAMIGMEGDRGNVGEEWKVGNMAMFQGRSPRKDDRISVHSRTHSRWIDTTIVLTPLCNRPKFMTRVAPVWPMGGMAYLVSLEGVIEDEILHQVVVLDKSTKWHFSDDPKPFKRRSLLA